MYTVQIRPGHAYPIPVPSFTGAQTLVFAYNLFQFGDNRATVCRNSLPSSQIVFALGEDGVGRLNLDLDSFKDTVEYT